MKSRLVFLFLILFSSVSRADYLGIVCAIDYKTIGILINETRKCSPIQFTASVAVDDFSNLVVGDGLVFSGNIDQYPKLVVIESISNVFLQRVIGEWIDKKNRYYSFTDFESLVVYDSKAKPTTTTFSYELYPNSTSRWNIILSTKSGTSVGLLRQFFDKQGTFHIEICLYINEPQRKRECSTLSRYVE